MDRPPWVGLATYETIETLLVPDMVVIKTDRSDSALNIPTPGPRKPAVADTKQATDRCCDDNNSGIRL